MAETETKMSPNFVDSALRTPYPHDSIHFRSSFTCIACIPFVLRSLYKLAVWTMLYMDPPYTTLRLIPSAVMAPACPRVSAGSLLRKMAGERQGLLIEREPSRCAY